jgi:hypothetical protein
VGKPRELLGDQLVAVDETQTARVERHRPSPRGANYMVLTDIHRMPRQIAEILDHSAADLAVCPRIDTHPHIHRHAAIAGIASRPASAFPPPCHPSSPQVVCVKIVTQLEHDQPTPSGLMADDHHPADPDRQNHRRGLVRKSVFRVRPGGSGVPPRAPSAREPYRWLGAGAVTLGMGITPASGAGIAHADSVRALARQTSRPSRASHGPGAGREGFEAGFSGGITSVGADDLRNRAIVHPGRSMRSTLRLRVRMLLRVGDSRMIASLIRCHGPGWTPLPHREAARSISRRNVAGNQR